MRLPRFAAMMLAAAMLWPGASGAQETSVPFGGLKHDSTLPVEITSEALQLDQAAGTAIFTGAVKVGQGTLRLAADRVEVVYRSEAAGTAPGDTGTGGTGTGTTGQIERLAASGNVTLSNGTEAAEARTATYEVATGIVEMEGDVLLTQGNNALSSQTLRIDLNAGTGVLKGRVQTIFTPARQ